MINYQEKEALEWFNWLKEECEAEGLKDINKIPELVRKAREQNKNYKKLRSDFENLKKEIVQIKVDKFNEGYSHAIKDYGFDEKSEEAEGKS